MAEKGNNNSNHPTLTMFTICTTRKKDRSPSFQGSILKLVGDGYEAKGQMSFWR